MATHVRVIGVLFGLVAAMLFAAAVFTPLFLGLVATLVGASGGDNAAAGATILGFAGLALSMVLGALALPYAAATWGLLTFRPWGRILGIVLGAISLTKVPFGTLLGVYALVILFRKDAEALFSAAPASK